MDFEGHVLSICSLVCSIMDLLENLRESRLFGDIQMTKFEKEVIYRSRFVHTLTKYLQMRYSFVNLD